MGFAAVLFCSHPELADTSDAELLSSLVAVLGTEGHPVAPLHAERCGPWLLGGSFHSTQTARLRLDTADTVELTETSDRLTPSEVGAVSATITSAELAAATREYMQSPRRMATAVSAGAHGGVDPVEVLFGSDPLEGRDVVGSLWWLYLDALGELRSTLEDPAHVASEIRRASLARSGGEVRLGHHLNALCCAGRVAAGTVTTCEWSGNRLTLHP